MSTPRSGVRAVRPDVGGPARPPVAFLLVYAAALAERHADAELRRHGLTIRQYGLLAQLHREPELTTSELARQFGITRQSLHQLANDLEHAGHLRREPGASGRTRRLVLTTGARALLDRVRRPLDEAEAGFLTGMRPADRDRLRVLLQRLLAQATDDETWL